MSENKKLEFRGGSFMALIPFAIFIVITIGLSFANAADLNMMIGAGVVGLLVGMLFVKDLEAYWDTILGRLGFQGWYDRRYALACRRYLRQHLEERPHC